MASKRIIICFDGTFDDTGDTPERTKPGSSVSRCARWILPPWLWQLIWVLRIFAMFKWMEHRIWPPKPREKLVTNASLLASAIKPLGQKLERDGTCRPIHQIVFYIGGIGALGNPQSRMEEAVTGNTMTYKVRYAYRLIVDNYRPGDEVFLFGFSRGAFSARAIADFINYRGIFRKDAMEHFDSAWTEFTQRPRTRLLAEQGQDRARSMSSRAGEDPLVYAKTSIRCIGVWDTVGSLGPPPLLFRHKDDISTARAALRRHGHFDVGSTPNAEYAFQALALDERRFDFYPAVWSLPSTKRPQSGRFCQTWFPGVHTDVGGGNPGGLSQYAFIWMISKIQEDNLLDLDEKFVQDAVITPIKTRGIPPWSLAIGGRDYVERITPLFRRLPQRMKDMFRTAHRNPQMPAASIDQSAEDGAISKDSNIVDEQKFHWTVTERLKQSNRSYWASCPALRKQDPVTLAEPSEQDIHRRIETPVGKDLEIMKYFTSFACDAGTSLAETSDEHIEVRAEQL